jgi:DNA-binding Lrp family transcriptional regulator
MERPQDSLIPVALAAAELGISSETVRRRIRMRQLPAVRRGPCWFVSMGTVEHAAAIVRRPALERSAAGPDSLVPVTMAAAELGISSDAVRRRIQTRQLAGERRGGRWYVSLSALEKALANAPQFDVQEAK